MAQLTWRNVNAPNFSDANRLLQTAGAGLQSGFSGLGDGVGEIRDRQRRNRSNAAIPMLAKVAQEQGVNPAIDEVGRMVRPEDRTDELNTLLANLRGTVTDYGRTRAQTGSLNASANSTRATTSRMNEDHSRRIAVEDQLAGQAGEILRQQERSMGVGHAPSGVSGDFQKHIPGIFAGESKGDYNALYDFQNEEGKRFEDTRLTDMSVDEALEFSKPSGEYGQWVKSEIGRIATPMGAYQVVGDTLRDAKKGLGLTGNERMTPELQDQIGEWIYKNQGLGAWVGYKPGMEGNSDAWGPGVGVSQMIPENNVVPPSVYQNLLETNRDSAEMTETERRDDQRIADEKAAAERARWARNQAHNILQNASTGAAGLDEGIIGVYNNPNVIGAEQDALIKALKTVHGEMSGVGENLDGTPSITEFAAQSGLGVDEVAAISPEQVQLYGDNITDNNEFNNFTEESLTNLALSKQASQDLTSALGQWNKDLGGDAENRVLNTDGVAELLQDIASETGIPAEKLVPFARNAIGNRSYVSEMMAPTKERIKDRLKPFLDADGKISADSYSQAMSRFRSGVRRGEKFAEIQGELEGLDAQFQGWLIRPESEARTNNLQRLVRQRKTLVNQAEALAQQARDASGFRSPGAPGGSGDTGGSVNGRNGNQEQSRGGDRGDRVDRRNGNTSERSSSASDLLSQNLNPSGRMKSPRMGGQSDAARALQNAETQGTQGRPATPQNMSPIQANEVIRQWLGTPEGREFMAQNPQLVAEMQNDPVGFMQKYVNSQTVQ